MTHAERILYAAGELVKKGHNSFTREDIRVFLGIDTDRWQAGYTAIFQGMRYDHPGRAPKVSERFLNVFIRKRQGLYILTDYGKNQIESIENQPDTSSKEQVNRDYLTERMYQTNHKNYKEKVDYLINNTEDFHHVFYDSEPFGKPCLFFHLQSLRTNREPASKEHLEYVYAMLTAWGMHRMGKGGSKMRSFEEFYQSIQPIKNEIIRAQNFDLKMMNEENWSIIEKIFKSIRVMESATSLVGNSKAMHHMLPNIIPPIDRQYTLFFLNGNLNIQNNQDKEWLVMREIIDDFFIPIATNPLIKIYANEWMRNTSKFPWDTSMMKMVDNLIIGGVRQSRGFNQL